MKLDHGSNGQSRTGNGSRRPAIDPAQPDPRRSGRDRTVSAYLAQPEGARIAFMVADLAQSLTRRGVGTVAGPRATSRPVRPFLAGHHA